MKCVALLLLLLLVLLTTACGGGFLGIISHDQYQIHEVLNRVEEGVVNQDGAVIAAVGANPIQANSFSITPQSLASVLLPGVTTVKRFDLTGRAISWQEAAAKVATDIEVTVGDQHYSFPGEFSINWKDQKWVITRVEFTLPADWPFGGGGSNGDYPALPPPSNPYPGVDEMELLDRFHQIIVSAEFYEFAPILPDTVALTDGMQVSYMNQRRFIELLNKDFVGVDVLAIVVQNRQVSPGHSTGYSQVQETLEFSYIAQGVATKDVVEANYVLEQQETGWVIHALSYKSKVFGLLPGDS